MNDFTRNMLQLARDTLLDRRIKVTVKELRYHAVRLQYHYRDLLIDAQADQTVAHVPASKLLGLLEDVWQMMWNHGEWYGAEEPDDDDEEACVHSAAHGLACLRWLNREDRGYAPGVECSDEEIAAWLEQVITEEQELSTYQMSLL